MTKDQGDLFEIRVGKPRADRGSRARSRASLTFQRQVMKAVAKAGGDPKRFGMSARQGTRAKTGRYNARGRGAKVMRTLHRDTGWKFDSGSGQRLRMRRVIVKARYVKFKGQASRAAYAHLRYLHRDGVSLKDEPGQLYSRALDTPDGPSFRERGIDDRHQFRLIVAPKDGVEIGDLRRFTRELMDQMEQDLETRLDWVAVDHHNTGHPHTHIVIRGMTDDGNCGDRGHPLTKESFGNDFKAACVAAGILDKSAHGLRKLSATIWAERGATEHELMAMYGWLTPQMAALYTRTAHRKNLALRAHDRLSVQG